jgi:hypothetical protein
MGKPVSQVDPHEQAKLFVLQLLPSHGVTTAEVEAALTQVLAMLRARNDAVVFDIQRLVRELEAALNVFQPESVSLEDSAGHEEWYVRRRDDIAWHFWDRYLRYVREQERLPPAVLDRLDTTTARVLRKLEDPRRAGVWDRRGMVVGQIQSGKTGNYTGLICRAADAGYRLVVVLAGIHNSLRSQTQLRLDTGFLGFDTQRRQLADTDAAFAAAALGVGRLVGAPRLDVASLTTSAELGDFGVARANSLPVMIGNYPVLLVVKKHRGVLDNLRDWVLHAHGTGEPHLVRGISLLLIDDEADNASVNTIDPTDRTGEYDPDIDPSKVNGAIRKLLNVFEKKAYVGYTATPYANIYIPDDWQHPEYGPDLSPSSFIEYLRPPSNYFGPARLFGVDNETEPLPLHRRIADHLAWIPDRHGAGLRVTQLPESLREAMRSFVLACAVRHVRGQLGRHNSMLVHVTRYTSVQQQVREQVEEELNHLRGRIRYGDGAAPSIRDELRRLWEQDFVPTSAAFGADAPPPVSWEDVEKHLDGAIDPITVKTINGTAQDALEYFDNRDIGLNVIAIGGDKLSRGLTLEGLTVSYYLRTSRAFDTLFQMGRWFGYRDGYEDVCRLYTTRVLWQAYREVTEANEELIREFEEMAARGLAPEDYGLRVRGSALGMLVTAPNKMRAGTRLRVGFAGTMAETVVLHCYTQTAASNFSVTDAFLTRLAAEHGTPTPSRSGNLVWSGVDGRTVADEFFAKFRTPETAWRVHAPTIAEYVRDRVRAGELVDWTVALISVRSSPRGSTAIGGQTVGLTTRNVLNDLGDKVATDGLYSIRRILSGPDEWTDFSPDEVREATEETRRRWDADHGRMATRPNQPSGRVVRHLRPATKGLLLLYPLTAPAQDLRGDEGNVTDGPLIGFAVSFPGSPGAPTVEYVVNRRFVQELLADEQP